MTDQQLPDHSRAASIAEAKRLLPHGSIVHSVFTTEAGTVFDSTWRAEHTSDSIVMRPEAGHVTCGRIGRTISLDASATVALEGRRLQQALQGSSAGTGTRHDVEVTTINPGKPPQSRTGAYAAPGTSVLDEVCTNDRLSIAPLRPATPDDTGRPRTG